MKNAAMISTVLNGLSLFKAARRSGDENRKITIF
jgi:hypothetical protein